MQQITEKHQPAYARLLLWHVTGRGVFMWLVCCLFVLFQFVIQLSAGDMLAGLMRDFHIKSFVAGIILSGYYYIYVALQTPAGSLVDRYGVRKLLVYGTLVCGLGCILFASAPQPWVAFVGRVIMGCGSAFAFVATLYVATIALPRRYFGVFVGLTETLAFSGLLFGGVLLSFAVQRWGWRGCMFAAATIVFLLGLLIAWALRSMPLRTKNTLATGGNNIKQLLRNKIVWCNGLYSGLMFSVVTVFIAVWAVPFVERARGINLVHATLYCFTAYIGLGLGAPIVGYLDALGLRRWLLFFGTLFCALLMMLLIKFPLLPLGYFIVCLILLGLCCSVYILTYVIAKEIAPAGMQSTSVGFTNTLAVGTAPVFIPFIGLQLNNMQHWSLLTYQHALYTMPVLLCIAAVLVFFLPVKRRV